MKQFIFFLLFVSQTIFAQIPSDYLYISPVPGSELNSRTTTIIFSVDENIEAASLSSDVLEVTGSKSGRIDGEVVLSSNGKTVIFKPSGKYAPEETITVSIKNTIRKADQKTLPNVNFSFKVTPLEKVINPYEHLPHLKEAYTVGKPLSNHQNDLDDTFPELIPEIYGETGEGVIFTTIFPTIENEPYYIAILNNDATPVYYKQFEKQVNDFKVQPNGLLSYALFRKLHGYTGGGQSDWIVMDNSFAEVDTFTMQNGYIADSHEFILQPNGHSLMVGYDLQNVDMSEYGGYPDALIAGSIIQELDQDKNVIFQWRSWDHIELSESDFKNYLSPKFDPIHVNSLLIDSDGHLLITSNRLTQVTKINRQTGEIIWRLGGVKNEFEFIGDSADFRQGIHTIQRLENGNILLYDNESRGGTEGGRAVEYELDTVNMTATLVWQFFPQGDDTKHATFMGNAQRLENGNTLIGWGSSTLTDSIVLTEVNNQGDIVYRLKFPFQDRRSYRSYRFPFPDGAPFADVTQNGIVANTVYDFAGEQNTGISIKVTEPNTISYDQINVKKYNYAPIYPEFLHQAPHVKPFKVAIETFNVDTFIADVSFDINEFAVKDPESALIYQREFLDNGVFEPLPTSYDAENGLLTAHTDKAGEFIVTYPDFESLVLKPQMLYPCDVDTANQNLPVHLEWNPIGLVNGFSFQIATDSDFNNLVVDEEYLKPTIYQFDSPEANTTYYWRVRALNDDKVGEWSDTKYFTMTEPFINMLDPLGGENFQVGKEYFVKWEDNLAEDVGVYLSPANAEEWTLLAVEQSTGAFKWEVSLDLEPGEYTLRVNSMTDTNMFAVSPNAVHVIDTITAVEDDYLAVENYSLHQNYPNPFNPSTMIQYDLQSTSYITLRVYSALGELVAELTNGIEHAGRHEVNFDATNLTSGIYFYRITANATDGSEHFSDTKKMLFVK